MRFLQLALILGLLGGCATQLAPPEPAPVTAPVRTPSPDALNAETPRKVIQRDGARWIEADWRELPGWGEDRATEIWPVLLRSCARPAPGWTLLCAQAALQSPVSDTEATLWLMQHLRPYRVESNDGNATGLATGYFEPQLEGSRAPQGPYQVPVLAAPGDLAQRKPYFTRQQIATEQAARQKPIAYVSDPIELAVMQVQGSGRLSLTERNGSTRLVRLAFAGHNDQPYQSIGKLLVERGELREASWISIREWARLNPGRLNELLWANPRYVFFREEPLPDTELGPRGGQGVPLTPMRSVAVDKASIPFGTPVWLDTTLPRTDTPLRRLAMAQDTGSAITGAVRIDYFWGWGREAEEQAGKMKQPLRLWALWPR
ncbi:MAG TPA: MltA domain-containing protein [Burkholderiaceae bacterium]|jgi:membrane-bound lytic murein transglycosylase A